jgi:hypothetical protein
MGWTFLMFLHPVIRVCESFEICVSSCASFVSKTVLCCLLAMTNSFVLLIFYCDSFTCTVFFHFWVCFQECTRFDHLYQFPNLIIKRKKKKQQYWYSNNQH